MDLIILAVLAPVFNEITTILLNAIPDTQVVEELLVRLIFPVLIFSLIFGILEYKNPLQYVQV